MRNGKRGTENFQLSAFLLVLLLTLTLSSYAQSERHTQVGAIAGMEFSTGLWNDVEMEVEEEFRFGSYEGMHLERWLTGLTFDTPVELIPWFGNRLHAGLHLGYVRHDDDKGYYDNRLRCGVDLSYRESYRRFRFTYRTRLLLTYRDEWTGDYKVNPKWYWRNKLQASYQAPASRFKYTLAAEAFWRLRAIADESFIDHLRFVFSVNYRLTRRQSISGFVRMDNELQVKKPTDRIYLGLSYHLKY